MGTIEHQEIQPVFAAANGRRERVVRLAGKIAAVLVAIWLIALFAGAIGFGRLPGLPGSGLLERNGHPAKAPPARPASRSDVGFAQRPAAAEPARSNSVSGQGASTRSSRTRAPARPATPAVVHRPAPVLVAPPPASPGKPQGKAVRRHGNQTLLPPPAPGNNGNAYGQSGTPPGQLKKQPSPPPPPPPA